MGLDVKRRRLDAIIDWSAHRTGPVPGFRLGERVKSGVLCLADRRWRHDDLNKSGRYVVHEA